MFSSGPVVITLVTFYISDQLPEKASAVLWVWKVLNHHLTLFYLWIICVLFRTSPPCLGWRVRGEKEENMERKHSKRIWSSKRRETSSKQMNDPAFLITYLHMVCSRVCVCTLHPGFPNSLCRSVFSPPFTSFTLFLLPFPHRLISLYSRRVELLLCIVLMLLTNYYM